MANLVEVTNLTKYYGKHRALSNVSFSLPRGKIIGLLGPNGSGKTTLIKVLVGLLNNYDGTVRINGLIVGPESKKIVSYLPDCLFLSPKWTAKKAIEYYLTFFPDLDVERAYSLLKFLGVDTNRTIKQLSKGTKEKVQLVLTLSRRADLYLFDEPIAGVDPAARELIFKLILENYQQDASILISTHLINDCEGILDHIMFIKEGELILFDDKKTIMEKTGKSIDQLFREAFRCF